MDPKRVGFVASVALASLTMLTGLGEPVATLNKSSLSETIEGYASKGLSGVVYVRIDGEVLFEAAYGTANESLGVPNSVDTIFGVGSRPIEFTVAAYSRCWILGSSRVCMLQLRVQPAGVENPGAIQAIDP